MTTYKDYTIRIWDRKGFQDGETGWVIEVIDPDNNDEDFAFDIALTQAEAKELGLEEIMGNWNIWDRDWITSLSDFIDNWEYDIPQRVYDTLEQLTE